MEKIRVEDFLEKCNKKGADLSTIGECLGNKTADQIDQLKIDLLRGKKGIEGWNPVLGIIPLAVSTLSLMVSITTGLSIKIDHMVIGCLLLFVVIYAWIAIRIGKQAKYEIALKYIDIVLIRKKNRERNKTELSKFQGMVVKMIFDDTVQYNKPHVQVSYREYHASVGIDGELLDGNLPQKQFNMLIIWLEFHKEEIYEAWNKTVRGEYFNKIKPLESIEYKVFRKNISFLKF